MNATDDDDARAQPSFFARVGPLDCVIEGPDGRSLRLDTRGRWLTARLAGGLYRRTMDGAVVVQRRSRDTPSQVAEPSAIHEAARALAGEMAQRLADDPAALTLTGPAPRFEAVTEALSSAAAWGEEAWRAERQRYEAAYDEAVEILPPDRYRDVVVLPATGCPNSACTFCAFYQGRGLAVKSPAAFRAHLEAVRALFGEALGLRRGLFLGSASALSLGQPRLLRAMALSREVLGDFPKGAAAFWDPDHAPARSRAQWEALVDAGLRRAYVGLETGLASLRAEVGKSGDLGRLGASIRAADEAGVEIGVIVLAGLGGVERAEAHRRATAEVVADLHLTERDIVYISGLEGPLYGAALDAEVAALRAALVTVTPARVAPYAMRAFRYFAG